MISNAEIMSKTMRKTKTHEARLTHLASIEKSHEKDGNGSGGEVSRPSTSDRRAKGIPGR